ncbi:MAG: glycosyltransferase family 2 protein [Alphaproteobacteria bacterium]
MPKVSIGLPVYNGSNYVGSALEAILAQTYTDFEVVICDNASTDDTQEICESFAARDPRIRYIRNPENLGASPNFNKTFHESTGQYFAWHAHDDYYEPTWLERCVEALDNDPDVVLSYTRLNMLDMEGNRLIYDAAKNEYEDRHGNRFMGEDGARIAEQKRADLRFKSVLLDVCWCLQVFGLFRRTFLETSELQRSYYGADKVLLAESAIVGKWKQIQEDLFNKRVHPKMSFFQSRVQKNKWIDSKSPVRSIAQVEMVKNYIAAIRASTMTPYQKIHSVLTVASMPFKRKNFWQKIFIPGPQNYLGIDFSRARS